MTNIQVAQAVGCGAVPESTGILAAWFKLPGLLAVGGGASEDAGTLREASGRGLSAWRLLELPRAGGGVVLRVQNEEWANYYSVSLTLPSHQVGVGR